MSAINKLKVIIIIMILILTLMGCSDNEYESLSKEEEPVVVILDEHSSIEDNELKKHISEENTIMTQYNEYNVNLNVDPKKRTFEGIQKVKFTNYSKDSLDNIFFNLYLNAFQRNSKIKPYVSEFKDKVYNKGFDEGFILIESVLINNNEVIFNQSETFLEIIMSEPIATNEEIEITMQFKGKVPKVSHRVGANDKVLWIGNFLPTIAVYDEDGWNSYSYYPIGDSFYTNTSNYTVSVTTPKAYTVIGTGDESETETETEKVTTIEAKMVRDFAIGISNQFQSEALEVNDSLTVNLYYTSNIGINTKKVLKTAEKSLEYYSTILGLYPYSELDIVEGDFYNSTGAEYSTFVIADYRALKGNFNQEVIAHLIGHQWFYNIVGNNPIKEPWLDEAIVTYLTNYIFDSEKTVDRNLKNKREELNVAMEPMREKSLYSELEHFSTWDSYYNIHYYKAEMMLHGLYKKMGKDKFLEFLKKYYENHSFKIAKKECFFNIAEEVYGSSLERFFNQWMEGEELPKF